VVLLCVIWIVVNAALDWGTPCQHLLGCFGFFCGLPWPTCMWYDVGNCNAEALHFVDDVGNVMPKHYR
jgi:hypothetical protein